MSCEQFQGKFELYSLGLLPGEERGPIRQHLVEGCEHCQREMTKALAIKSLMLENAPPVVPPQRLEERVLAAVGIHQQVWAITAAVIAAGLLVTAAWFASQRDAARSEADQLRAILAAAEEDARQDQMPNLASRAFAFLESPDAREYQFDGGGISGRLYWEPSELGVLIIGRGFAPVAEGLAYQLTLYQAQTKKESGNIAGEPESSGQKTADEAAKTASSDAGEGAREEHQYWLTPEPDGTMVWFAPAGTDAGTLTGFSIGVREMSTAGEPETIPEPLVNVEIDTEDR